MKLFQPRILMIGTLSLLTLCACNPVDISKTSSTSKGPFAATVNGAGISESSVNKLVQQRVEQGQQDSPALRAAIIDQLSMQLILSQEASKKGLDKKAEVSDQIELIRQSILANAFAQNYLDSNPISDDMLKAEFESIKDKIAGNEYKARHILVASEDEAKAIIAQLNTNPGAFSALAKQKSLDAGSKTNGGDLGWFDPRGMVPEFSAAVTKLEKGKFTEEPVKSQFGYHIIVLDDSRAKKVPEFDQIKNAFRQQIQQKNLKKLIDDLKANAKIKIANASDAANTTDAASTKHAE